jgi:predicted aspartyl protease
MTKRIVLVLASAVASCQPTGPSSVDMPADSAAGEVAFELVGPNDAAILVPVTVNGRDTLDFVLDTGATMTCIDRALADSLGLRELRGVIGMGAGAGGGGRLRMIEFDSVRVGGATARALPGCTLDLSHVQEIGLAADGLLGLNFLKPFRVTLDFDREVLTLRAP